MYRSLSMLAACGALAACAAAPPRPAQAPAPAPTPVAAPVPTPVAAMDFGPGCNKPVMLVVWIEHLDRAKSGKYGEALRSSQIVRRHGGEYKAVSPPLRTLEGEWPADRGFVVERYPCLAAFETFWYSDEYQKRIKPLREGSGEYTIALFEERAR